MNRKVVFATGVVSGIIIVCGWIGAQGSTDEAGVPGKVAAMVKDMRALRNALEAYHIDWNSFVLDTTMAGQEGIRPSVPGFAQARRSSTGSASPGSLTTPISYLVEMPVDPFAATPGSGYAYKTTGSSYLVWSHGPDGKYDLDPSAFDPSAELQTPDFHARFSYDPTNGLLSQGDIWFTRHDLSGVLSKEFQKQTKEESRPRTSLLSAVAGTLQTTADAVMPPEDQVNKARRDLRRIATAVETYNIDNNAYPVHTTATERQIGPQPLPPGVPTFHKLVINRPYGMQTQPDGTRVTRQESPLITLTTPVAYLSSMPLDPFAPGQRPYAYYSNGGNYISWSCGPDGEYQVVLEEVMGESNWPQPEFFAKFAYDPSNGTVSSGDVLLTGPRGGEGYENCP